MSILQVNLCRKSDRRALFATIFAFSAFIASAESDFSELLSGVRIGMLHPSGIVVWPIDSSPDEAKWFGKDNWGERDRRRRQAMKMTDHAIMAWPGFRSLKDKQITVAVDGESIHAVVRGIARIQAGCGEFEPSWYASVTGHSAKRTVESFKTTGFGQNWRPVLVMTEENHELQTHQAIRLNDWPGTLTRAVKAANIPIVDSVAFQSKNIWTVYADRVVTPSRLGASRTTWIKQADTFIKLHQEITNSTIESYLERVYSSPDDFEGKIQHYRIVVGRIYELLETQNAIIFLTKYQGYESIAGILERLRNGQLQTLRLDGFDQAC